jgi:hypothetical protein
MNTRLPPLKNFKAIEAETEPPESLWKRLYFYVFLIALVSGIFAGAAFLLQSGAFSRGHRLAKEDLRNVEKWNARVYLTTKIAGAIGAGVGLLLSIKFDRRNK